jgi:hypothetical protein
MNSNHYKVEGHNDLIRDIKTNAIINTNMNEYENYKTLKKIKEQEKQRIECLENDVSEMKNDLSEIKNLLRALANGSN